MLPDVHRADTDDGGDYVPEKALWHQGKGWGVRAPYNGGTIDETRRPRL